MSDRRVPPGGGLVLGILLGLAFWLVSCSVVRTIRAQEVPPPFLIAVDTAGIVAVAPDVYMTWVFAKATPTSLPSSGIIVAWDCGKRMVKRLAQVKYEINSTDSASVSGNIQEVDRPWVPVSDERMYVLVCAVGRAHAAEAKAAEKAEQQKSRVNRSRPQYDA